MPSPEQEEEDTVNGSDKLLWQQVLSWDYVQLCQRLAEGKGVVDELQPVPPRFDNVQAHREAFEPLMLEECAALLMRGSQEGEDQSAHSAAVVSVTELGEFTTVVMKLDAGAGQVYSRNDMLLLSRDDPQDFDAMRSEFTMLGVVEGWAQDDSMSARLCLGPACQRGDQAGLQRVASVKQELGAGGPWFVQRLSNMSTIMREWGALHAWQGMPFTTTLLACAAGTEGYSRPSSIPACLDLVIGIDLGRHPLHTNPALVYTHGDAAVPELGVEGRFWKQEMRTAMAAVYNESQMAAVTCGLTGQPINLIQGPPGTGKTRTILGLLGVVLHAQAASPAADGAKQAPQASTPAQILASLSLSGAPWVHGLPNARDSVKPWHKGSPVNLFGLAPEGRPRLVKSGRAGRHVLVCAPSNSALDELLGRLLSAGIFNRLGGVYRPSVVRVGLNPHHSVAHVALDALIDHRMSANKDAPVSRAASRADRERARVAVLREAAVVGATLSFSGSSALAALGNHFDVVIIDEAAQAVEPSTLIPLVTGCKQAYLVGDPVQLPATVISSRAAEAGYNVSLFKRLQSADFPVNVLDTQYRMHPDISAFPARAFYQGRLKDAPGLEETCQAWHEHKCFGPLAFLDVPGAEEAAPGQSLQNSVEAEMALHLFSGLLERYPELRKHPGRIGVMSPYRGQVTLLRAKFKDLLSGGVGPRGGQVDVLSIDGFQGREKDVVIFSAVRTRRKGGIGFVADERRINVGLTRARSSLLILGHAGALQKDAVWSSLIRHARETGCMFRMKQPLAEHFQKLCSGEIKAEPPLPPEKADEEWHPEAEPDVDADHGLDPMAASNQTAEDRAEANYKAAAKPASKKGGGRKRARKG